MNIPQAAGAGLGLGICWGVAARGWMRLIAEDPEFSWSGTGAIVGACAVGGLILGFLAGARAAGWSRGWRALGLVNLLIFAGPGIPFVPAYLLGGLLFRRSLAFRLVGAIGVLGSVVLLWLINQQDPAPAGAVTLYGGFLVLSVCVAAGSGEFYRRTKEAPSLRSGRGCFVG